jgi:4'-phosphopantetheinyl transferase
MAAVSQSMQKSEFRPLPFDAVAEQADSHGSAVDVWRLRAADWRPVLALYAGVPLAKLTLTVDAHGKPRLVAPTSPSFNLSHCGDVVLLAIGRGIELGVDVEALRQRPRALQLAQRYFTADEAAALAALPEDGRLQAFYRLWTAKEAVLKALGRGLSFGLHRVGFRLEAGGAAVLPQDFAHTAAPASAWMLHALAPAPGYLGALAWRGGPRMIRRFALSP